MYGERDEQSMNVMDVVLEYNAITGKMPQQCLEEIQDLQKHLNGRKFDSFLEVGTSYGGSLYLFCKLFLNKGAKVVTIDKHRYKEAEKTIEHLKDYSIEYLNNITNSVTLPNKFDLVLIDGDHDYKNARRDFDSFKGKVTLVHDTKLWEGTIRLREELEKEYNTITFEGKTVLTGSFGDGKKNHKGGTGLTWVE